MQEYTHNPTPVDAIQVARPWKTVQFHVPSASKVTTGSGALAYFRVVNVSDPLNVPRAYEGDWIVRDRRTRKLSVLTDEEFQYRYGKKDEDVNGDAAED